MLSNPPQVNRIRLAAGVAVLAVLTSVVSASAAPSAELLVSGRGGQSVTITVGSGGLDVAYPFFAEPRVPGPDGAVGGVAIQRLPGGRLVGGVLLQNAPGFDHALDVELADFGHSKLRAGRYRLTLLGTGPQSVHLQVLGATHARRLSTAGPVHPVTRTMVGGAQVFDSWSGPLGTVRRTDVVVIGGGSGGDLQQAEEAELCLQTGPAADEPCLSGGGDSFTSPGAGASAGWSSMLYPPGSLAPGSYVFSGHVVGVGPASRTGHAGVVISLRS